MSASTDKQHKPTPMIKSVVVVRHGERLDYVMRDAGQNWVATSERPWDPPLTDTGTQQAQALGEALPQLLQDLKLPPIAAVYSSPFLRCRQTAAGLSSKSLSIRVELGLGESVNENWYRSWAVPGTDGTWGYQKKEHPELDPETLHPASQAPVQPLLDWKAAITDPATKERMDDDYVSKSSLEMPYSLRPPKFESFRMQRDRMAQTMTRLSNDLVNETIVLVSHGGPVTHLYESLTGNKWTVHGVSKYCCYSIYQQKEGEETWTPLVVNQQLGDEEPAEDTINQTATSNTFTWA